jgi:hypothetical protein
VHGGNAADPKEGAFAEYAVARKGVGWEDAAGLGVAMVTVGEGVLSEGGVGVAERREKR